MMKIGSTTISDLKVGSAAATKAYLGSQVVWETDTPPALNPLTASNVVLIGASLTSRYAENEARNAYINDRFTHMGYTGTLANEAVGGQRLPGGLTTWNNVSSSYGLNDFGISSSRGNEVTQDRPYATDPDSGGFAGSALDSPYATNWAALWNQFNSDLGGAVVTDISTRFYSTAPAVDPHDPATFANGSLPYNENIVEPLIASLAPASWRNGEAIYSDKAFTANTPWLVTTGDGSHLNARIEHTIVENVLWLLRKEYDDSRANVSGRTVVVSAVGLTNTLNDNIVGTTSGGHINGLTVLQTKIKDVSGLLVANMAVRAEGGTEPVVRSMGAVNGTTSPYFQDSDTISAYNYATASSDLTRDRSLAYRVIVEGLPSGQQGVVKILGSSNVTASDQVGRYTINGVFVGNLDASLGAASNELVANFTATSDGRVVIEVTPDAGSRFGYFNAAEFIFDGTPVVAPLSNSVSDDLAAWSGDGPVTNVVSNNKAEWS